TLRCSLLTEPAGKKHPLGAQLERLLDVLLVADPSPAEHGYLVVDPLDSLHRVDDYLRPGFRDADTAPDQLRRLDGYVCRGVMGDVHGFGGIGCAHQAFQPMAV